MAEKAKRSVRVSEGVRQELAQLVIHRLRDPRITGVVVISRVEMSDDLRNAKVHVRMLEGGDDAAKRKSLLEGLESARPMLQREVTKALELRYAPAMRFFYDEGTDKATRIEELLAEVELERRGKK